MTLFSQRHTAIGKNKVIVTSATQELLTSLDCSPWNKGNQRTKHENFVLIVAKKSHEPPKISVASGQAHSQDWCE